MSADDLAKVGDVIEHGQDIPANVRTVEDKMGDVHRRRADDPDLWGMNERAGDGGEEDGEDYAPWPTGEVATYAPLTVVEVDPEPLPAETGLYGKFRVERVDGRDQPGGDKADAAYFVLDYVHDRYAQRAVLAYADACAAELPELASDLRARIAITPWPTESGPLVLTLPEVPAEAVALIGVESGERWNREDGYGDWGTRWELSTRPGFTLTLAEVLDREAHGVTPEFAPPREPRTWPKLTDQSDDDLPDVVQIIGGPRHAEVWRRYSPDGVLYTDGPSATTLAELRTMGEVREVLGDA